MARIAQVAIVEQYLQAYFPGQWVVVPYEPVISSNHKIYYDILKQIDEQNFYNCLQCIIDFGACFIVCENEQEANNIFKMFPEPEVICYCMLFGVSGLPDGNPKGEILSTNS